MAKHLDPVITFFYDCIVLHLILSLTDLPLTLGVVSPQRGAPQYAD